MSAVPAPSPPPGELPPPEIDPSPAPVEIPSTPPVQTPVPAPNPPTVGRARVFGFVVSVLLGGAAVAAHAASLDAADHRFMDDAVAGGMVEIVFGRLAVEKAQADPVRQFGAHMVEDHNKANEALKALAAAKGVSVPTGLTPEDKLTASHLKKLKGPAFDRQYMARMLADHQKTVALFTRAATAASDADVKQFAAANLPTLKSHLDMARQIVATPAAPLRRGTAGRE